MEDGTDVITIVERLTQLETLLPYLLWLQHNKNIINAKGQWRYVISHSWSIRQAPKVQWCTGLSQWAIVDAISCTTSVWLGSNLFFNRFGEIGTLRKDGSRHNKVGRGIVSYNTCPLLSLRPRDQENHELIEIELRETVLWFFVIFGLYLIANRFCRQKCPNWPLELREIELIESRT